MHKRTLGEKMGEWWRHILSCCDREDEDEERPALQIGWPTNFRREDITIPGLDPEQQRFLRAKAISDAGKMHLTPLHRPPPSSLPPNANSPPSYTPTSPRTPVGAAGGGGWDRVKAHSRKISNSLANAKKPLGYPHEGGVGELGREDSKYEMEMRGLMEPSAVQVVVPAGKGSAESFCGVGGEVVGRGW